jgi:hypothetical protein
MNSEYTRLSVKKSQKNFVIMDMALLGNCAIFDCRLKHRKYGRSDQTMQGD